MGVSEEQLLTVPARWDFEYRYFAGAAASRFFHELRERRIMGTRCDRCGRILVPARAYCDACFERTGDWVQIGTTGRLEAFTILATKFPGLPDPPRVIGYVTLAGADTALLNYVDGIALDDLDRAAAQLQLNPPVDVVFDPHPQGRITDFHFRLAAGG